MYYHCRPLKYVEWGKVVPHADPDDWLLPAYRWLGYYCGYCPQVWLSRGDIGMTGYRVRIVGKARKWGPAARRDMRDKKDNILFGFDIVKGFPVDDLFWNGYLLQAVANMPTAGLGDINKRIAGSLDESLKQVKDEDEEGFEAGKYPLETAWERCRDFDAFLRDYAFVERDQLVVPALNLKSAKEVVCRDERQKKALRRMGFIEDRIRIRNMWRWPA